MGGPPSPPAAQIAPPTLQTQRTQLACAAEGPRFAPGDVIDRKYRLERPLGKGGMAEVWLALHETLKTHVAVKLAFDSDHPDRRIGEEVIARFRFEAQISARLCARTRHVVAVHDAGAHRDVPYLVMEFVEGRTLLDEMSEGWLDPQRLADVLDDIADGLSVAHEMDIVHRDLKPSNLMVNAGPAGATTVKIADFGIAKSMQRDAALDLPKETAMGLMVGTPDYMSPEQFLGEGIDLRSDIWALGVLAYEALTGVSPFSGSTLAEVVTVISTRPFEPPSRRRPDLPRKLDAWFHKALAKSKEQRFGSVHEMARAFRSALPAPGPRRAPTRLLGAAAALLIVTLSAALAWLALRPAPPRAATLARLPPLRMPTIRPSAPTTAAPPDRAPATTAATAPTAATTATAETTATASAPAPLAAPLSTPPMPKPKEMDPSEIQ